MSEPNGPKRFDLSKLAEASAPTSVQTAGTLNGEANPFLAPVRESYAEDQQKADSGWREVPMSSEQLDDVIASLRGLSAWFGSTKNGKQAEPIGVHIRVEYTPDGADRTVEVGPKYFEEIPRDGRDVFLKYTGRARLQRGRKSKRDADAPVSGADRRTVEGSEAYDDDQVDSELTSA